MRNQGNMDWYLSNHDISNKNTKLVNKKGKNWEWHTKKSASYDPNMVFGESANYTNSDRVELAELEHLQKTAEVKGNSQTARELQANINEIHREAREDFWIFSMGNDKPQWMIDEDTKNKIPASIPTHQQISEDTVKTDQMKSANGEWTKLRKRINGRGVITSNKLVADLAKSDGYRVSQKGTKFKIKNLR